MYLNPLATNVVALGCARHKHVATSCAGPSDRKRKSQEKAQRQSGIRERLLDARPLEECARYDDAGQTEPSSPPTTTGEGVGRRYRFFWGLLALWWLDIRIRVLRCIIINSALCLLLDPNPARPLRPDAALRRVRLTTVAQEHVPATTRKRDASGT